MAGVCAGRDLHRQIKRRGKMKKDTITDEGALRLLEAIMDSSADDFKKGVTAFIDASIEEQKQKDKLEKVMKKLYKVQQDKINALKTINDEYHFLKGDKIISPTIDGDFVLAKLMKEAMRELNVHNRNYAKGLIK